MPGTDWRPRTPTALDTGSRVPVDPDRAFWLQVRRALLQIINAIEERHGIASVVEQHATRKAKQPPTP